MVMEAGLPTLSVSNSTMCQVRNHPINTNLLTLDWITWQVKELQKETLWLKWWSTRTQVKLYSKRIWQQSLFGEV